MGKSKIRIDYGCNAHKKDGFLGVDIHKNKGVDIVIDKDKPLPFDDDTVDEIYCSHVLEHVDDLYFTITEFHRICKNGAIIEIIVPHFTQVQSEYHRRFCCYNFLHTHCIEREFLKYPHFFNDLERELIFSDKLEKTIIGRLLKKYPQAYEQSFIRSFIFALEVHIKLEVIK